MRRCFLVCGEETPFVREFARGDDGRGEDGWLLEPEACNVGDAGRNDAGVGSGNVGEETAVSILRMNSHGSCTAAFKTRLTACCNDAGTSA
jgi:hypothetical protein